MTRGRQLVEAPCSEALFLFVLSFDGVGKAESG